MNITDPVKAAPGEGSPEHTSETSSITILAREDLQNTFLCNSLNEQLEVDVTLSSDFSVPSMRTDGGAILLIDAQNHSGEGVIRMIEDYQRGSTDDGGPKVAFFNISAAADDELRRDYVGWRCLRGLFRERANVDHLVRGLRVILEGEFWLPRGYLGSLIVNGTRPMTAAVEDPGLTQKEREILKILVLGKTNEEIATSLSISPHTVKTHVYNLYKKLGVNNRVEASNWAQNFLGRN